jgi:hypothetical protein
VENYTACGLARVATIVRIVFSLETEPTGEYEVILLLDIGTHDEVY